MQRRIHPPFTSCLTTQIFGLEKEGLGILSSSC
jgi:hypothetical protein